MDIQYKIVFWDYKVSDQTNSKFLDRVRLLHIFFIEKNYIIGPINHINAIKIKKCDCMIEISSVVKMVSMSIIPELRVRFLAIGLPRNFSGNGIHQAS